MRYRVPLYNYCITSNHVHVIAHVEDPDVGPAMMGYRVECTILPNDYIRNLAAISTRI